ncbi:MAG: hypothetical protein K2Y37_08065, partial [Pirellulales bacterium]|nr:hypothetical protein [Pirellulales bacterium]
DFLRVRKDDNNAPYKDWINVTVLWVDLSASASADPESPDSQLPDSPIYEGKETSIQLSGVHPFGMQRAIANTTYGDSMALGGILFRGQISPNDLDRDSFDTPLTTGFARDSESNATVTFGFVFRRTVDAIDYYDGNLIHSEATVFQGQDDSFEAFQDVNPDPENDRPTITDLDGPAIQFSIKDHFVHRRLNFVEHASYSFLAGVHERSSIDVKWSMSADAALNYEGKATFIVDLPNNGIGTNEVRIGSESHIDKNYSVPTPTLSANGTNVLGGGMQITRGQDVTIVITGTNLIGDVFLKRDTQVLFPAKNVLVKETDAAHHYSDLTEIHAVFKTTAGPSDGWEVYMKNDNGTSNSIGGFSLVDPS